MKQYENRNVVLERLNVFEVVKMKVEMEVKDSLAGIRVTNVKFLFTLKPE